MEAAAAVEAAAAAVAGVAAASTAVKKATDHSNVLQAAAAAAAAGADVAAAAVVAEALAIKARNNEQVMGVSISNKATKVRFWIRTKTRPLAHYSFGDQPLLFSRAAAVRTLWQAEVNCSRVRSSL